MKQYSILIKGTGPCGEGDENSADMRLLEFMKSLQNSGHNLTSVSILADGIMTPILGGATEHPAGEMPAQEGITLATVSAQISQLDQKFSRFERYERKEDKQENTGPTVKPVEQKKGGRAGQKKPAEDKPAEDKPAEDKPAEDKPAEDKPAEDKPAEEQVQESETTITPDPGGAGRPVKASTPNQQCYVSQ